jgi:hypothetical protein
MHKWFSLLPLVVHKQASLQLAEWVVAPGTLPAWWPNLASPRLSPSFNRDPFLSGLLPLIPNLFFPPKRSLKHLLFTPLPKTLALIAYPLGQERFASRQAFFEALLWARALAQCFE